MLSRYFAPRCSLSARSFRQASSTAWQGTGRAGGGWTRADSFNRDELHSKTARCTRINTMILSAYSTWKHRHHTAAYHRYWAEMQGCRQQARERLMGAANKQARFVGTMRAGAPRRPPPALTVSRPLVAYLASHDKRRIHRSPQLLLAFVAPLTGHTAFHSFFNPCQCVEEIFLVSWSTLKSSDILGQLNLLARTTFSLLPLAAGLRMKSVRLARRHGAAYVARWFHPSRGFVIGLVLTPLALFALAYLASLEQTPISGRWRSLFVNDGERREIVRAFAGDRMAATTAEWLALLRRMLGDEAMRAPAGTLLGGACLDAAADWRVGFVEDTLHALESGIPLLGSRGPTGQLQVAGLVVPAASPPLAYARPAPHYRVLVVDRPEPNAFSCGFAPVGQRVGPGVIVVFSGALDAILAKHVGRGGFQGVPTREEQQDLAVLLSHELAHLLCSHTLEVHASDSQRPQLRKIFVDVLRTALYPITALLGPFANEAIAASLNTGFDDHHGVSSSCDSRLHETEADAVSLRILAHAGFDPRHAIRYWEDRIATAGKADAFLGEPADLSGTGLQRHSAGQRSGFLRSHPVDVDRLTAIRADLASWSRVAEI